MLQDSEEGNTLKSMTEMNTAATQVWGSRKEIKPLLLLYSLICGSMDGTTMVLLELSARIRR
jgi:hypothetical protein